MNTNPQFQPFRDCSAWFSVSVQPDIITQWGDYGGKYTTKEFADFLFSESATTNDTKLIYQQHSYISVFRPEWITAVIEERCPATEIPVAKYLLLPDYCTPLHDQNTMTTPRPSKNLRHFISKGIAVNPSNSDRSSEIELKKHNERKTKPEQMRELEFQNMAYPASTVEFCTEQLQDIVHIDTLGPIAERLIDFVPNRDGLAVKRLAIN